jgi:hypothetical protein
MNRPVSRASGGGGAVEVVYALDEADCAAFAEFVWDRAARKKLPFARPRKAFIAHSVTMVRKSPQGLLRGIQKLRVAVAADALSQTLERRDVDEGVEIQDRVELRAPWDVVEEVHVTDGHAYFVLANQRVIIVPAHAFADADTFRQFAATARGYHRAGPAPREAITATPHRLPRPEEGITL